MKLLFSLALLLVGAWTIAADPALPDAHARSKNLEPMPARNEIDAMLLFEDGQARLRAGKYGTAAVTFQTLIAVYPESPLVARATEALRSSEALEQAQSNSRIVRSIRFESLKGVRIHEVLERFNEREIELAVEKPATVRTMEEAKTALRELLSERGVENPRVEVESREIPPRSLEIVFRVAR